MVRYSRCNNFMSLALDKNGQPCRYMFKAATEQAVLDNMCRHVQTVHNVDPKALMSNIKACIFETGTKVFGTRAPDAHH
jgi:predicted small metal-binding protein